MTKVYTRHITEEEIYILRNELWYTLREIVAAAGGMSVEMAKATLEDLLEEAIYDIQENGIEVAREDVDFIVDFRYYF